jgi:glutathione peroxidase
MNSLKAFVDNLLVTDKPETQKASESIYKIKINSLQGKPIDLCNYKGKKILFINVASKCGFTPQYKALQELQEAYNDDLVIIGVPCNQFGKQEPGNSEEIQQFCEINYGVTFLITEKLNVKGSNQHSLYEWLTKKSINGKQNSTVKWNFQKYLVDEEGELLDYFYAITKPMNSRITSHLKKT